MKIERVDEKTVKCFLTNEELEEYEIDYRDFVMRSDKAREVVQEIMEQASEEVGYKPPRFAFDLQIMMVPDQGLLLTFSEKDPDVKDSEQLIECLKEYREGTCQGTAGRQAGVCRVCFFKSSQCNELCGGAAFQSSDRQRAV